MLTVSYLESKRHQCHSEACHGLFCRGHLQRNLRHVLLSAPMVTAVCSLQCKFGSPLRERFAGSGIGELFFDTLVVFEPR
jgi:hypothetical protein